MTKRYLILNDGTSFVGKSIGAESTVTGEIVMNTNLNGYQESITDPIYHNQIVAFSQPSIGNIGINRKNYESILTSAKGIVIHHSEDISTSYLKKISLDSFLTQRNIPGITDIDTRYLLKYIMKHDIAKASLVDVNDEHAFDQLNAAVLSNQQIQQVATPKPYLVPGNGKTVAILDFGLKEGIVRQLAQRDCNVIVLPFDTSYQEIIDLDPEGIILSTGPGSPHEIDDSVLTTINQLEHALPVFGMGLGHELLAMANGASVYRMKLGHHGSNHPIKKIITNQIIYANQAQDYAVDPDSIDTSKLIVTYIDLINGTVQGIRHRDYPAFSVQFSPDGSSGPTDSIDLFDEFLESITAHGR